ncbi:hypothetical protein BJX61DRAFT_502864 [Aspergillus egyptiacus]|nr:hypothetical protein BJX61DRAFT_502864 [Aspergillus egyptiacus]
MGLWSFSRLAIAVLFLAWSLPYLRGRQVMLTLLVKNSPANLPEINAFAASSLKLVDKVRNCEDGLLIEEDGLAILSCDPGRDHWNTVMGTFHPNRSQIPNGQLWIYRYEFPDQSEDSLLPIEIEGYPGDFSLHPLGVEYHRETSTLFVCNHHLEGSRIDVFTLHLSEKKAIARHTRTILDPRIRTPNSIVALNENEFYVTNDHYMRRKDSSISALVETYLAIPGGSVVYVNLAAEPVAVRTVARVPFANGVALLNESAIAVASSSAAEVRLYSILGDRSLQQTGTIQLAFAPDNLSVDKDGALLIAGHPHPPTLDQLIHHRRSCIDKNGVVPRECWKATSPTWVSRWTASQGLEDLYVSSTGYGSGCTAARDVRRNVGLVTGLYENGILMWRE